jgi:hypothetical protein
VLLAIGPEERHGYAIMAEVARITDGAIRLGPGAIYTTIRRLLDDGLLEESDERPDPELDDQRRRYYRLTALGRAVAAGSAFETLCRPAMGLGFPNDRPASTQAATGPSASTEPFRSRFGEARPAERRPPPTPPAGGAAASHLGALLLTCPDRPAEHLGGAASRLSRPAASR